MAEDVLKRFTRMKERIESLKTERATIQGRLSTLLGQLEERHKVRSLKDAQSKLKKLEAEASALEGRAHELLDEIEGTLNTARTSR